ncbi:MAG TPA: CoA-binding protein [Candidatus Omnitrophota bacterium]|jgi:predicted CoA-binding protein|nr:CoA-binding protein [Candidatus Omnitrophota bacterium]HSA32045.1 CoA-binding protein [Candidatus Omnitrophota bacterium]
MNVAVIGASDKPERYSYQAVLLLKGAGHRVYPVHRRVKGIQGIAVFSSLEEIQDAIDTVTLYVNADISNAMAESILAKRPRRIIFNPGAENLALEEAARREGIETLNACTLVLLKTGRF